MISKSFSKRFGLFGDSLNNFRTCCFSQARNLFRDMKEEKKDRCPHCFKEFTNLRHHVNQQHIQVNLSFRFGRESLTNLLFSVEKLQVWRLWLHLLFEDRPGETHYECPRQVPEPVPFLWKEVFRPATTYTSCS